MEDPATKASEKDSVPDIPSLAPLIKSHPQTFIIPLKKINEGHDVSAFLISKAYGDLTIFLLQLNRAMFPCYVQGFSASGQKGVQTWDLGCQAVEFSKTVQTLRDLLEELEHIIDQVPPDPGPRRFGNASFKKWYRSVEERSPDLLKSHLPGSILQYPHESDITAEAELSSYLLGSFGSPQRLDYGSGHELSFLAFLGCIWKLGGFSTSGDNRSPSGNEERAIVLGLIAPYLSLIRRLILTYTLEPAGSHGVWGLDDHSFIPYIFGSAQYGPPITPSSQTPTEGSHPSAPEPSDVSKPAAIARQRQQNMYFSAIGFIHDVKKGPFWEHSPMLYDISGIRAGWGKINKGMLKMYDAEVLSKFPVVQHFPFGSLFRFDPDPNAPPPPPSVHAAAQPVRAGLNASSADKVASPRLPPQPATQAPWATNAPTPPAHQTTKTAPTPNPTSSTTAPWARGPTTLIDPADRTPTHRARTAESGTVAPWASRQPTPPTSQKARTANGNAPSTTMPPPTRAPRAPPP